MSKESDAEKEEPDKRLQKPGFILDVVAEGVPTQVWMDEAKAKAAAVKGLDLLEKQCRPDDLDNAPPPPISDNRGNYPTENPQFGYGFEDKSGKFTKDIRWQDGHHPEDRWNLTDQQIGQGIPHEHDDYGRAMPTTLDAGLDAKNFRIGTLAQDRVPDWSVAYSQVPGGDEMGYSTDDRAKYGHGVLGPGDKLEFPAKKTKSLEEHGA